jgi:hypothetical protein
MQVNSELYRNGVDYPPGPQHYPSAIESTPTDLVAAFSGIPYADFSCFALLRALGMDHAWLGHDAVPAWPAIALFGLVFAGWCWATCGVVATRLLPGLAGWIFLADLVLPAYRDTYNDVLILPVVAAALLEPGEIPKAVMLCAAALPIGVVVYALVPEQIFWINLPTALFTIGAVWIILASAVPPRSA